MLKNKGIILGTIINILDLLDNSIQHSMVKKVVDSIVGTTKQSVSYSFVWSKPFGAGYWKGSIIYRMLSWMIMLITKLAQFTSKVSKDSFIATQTLGAGNLIITSLVPWGAWLLGLAIALGVMGNWIIALALAILSIMGLGVKLDLTNILSNSIFVKGVNWLFKFEQEGS